MLLKRIFWMLLILGYSSFSIAFPNKKASLVVDLNSGKILHATNAKELRYPASLVKMMTLYITFKELNAKKLKLQQKLLVSHKAASMPRLNLALKPGSKISVYDAILGIIIHSANDSAVVLAEAIAGSEAKFAELMNKEALRLNMRNTHFTNASGLPNKNQKTTAIDLAKLAIALKRDFPQYFPWFSLTSFTVNGTKFVSHNRVVKNFDWATGLKTGYTFASGFNLATTASKNGKHLVGIVLGGETAKIRDKQMVSLLSKYLNTSTSSSIKFKNKK